MFLLKAKLVVGIVDCHKVSQLIEQSKSFKCFQGIADSGSETEMVFY